MVEPTVTMALDYYLEMARDLEHFKSNYCDIRKIISSCATIVPTGVTETDNNPFISCYEEFKLEVNMQKLKDRLKPYLSPEEWFEADDKDAIVIFKEAENNGK